MSKLNNKTLVTYLRHILQAEYNLKYDDRTVAKILDGLEVGINSLIESGYDFKVLGMNFITRDRKGKIFRDIHTDEIQYIEPYKTIEVKFPKAFMKELKRKTRYNTGEIPTRVGITKEEYVIKLKELKSQGLITDDEVIIDGRPVTLID